MVSPLPSSYNAMRTMQANSRVSATEVQLRRAVWKAGARGYRVRNRLPGRPDFAFHGARLAVFVHGCFWHRCATCQLPEPRSNGAFWRAKFERNLERDERAVERLRAEGWTVHVVWEHEIRADVEIAARRVVERLSGVMSGRSDGGRVTGIGSVP
jgi:DNA mismatch endonuclease (patch repair protein)